jgi:hypothetical protein
LLGTAVAVVIIGVLTMAWFSNNTKVNGTNMSVTVVAPEYVQISLGHVDTVNSVLSRTSGGTPVDPSVDADWSYNEIDVSEYYRFGRLFPASSISGEAIYFTPDSVQNGRFLKSEYRTYRADGYTDGDIKHIRNNDFVASDDVNGLNATAYIFQTVSEKSVAEYWNGYNKGIYWYDTNDDGYYVDIPIWFRTNSATDVNLSVEGYVTKKNGNTDDSASETDSLYKAVRVAILNSNYNAAVSANETTGYERNIIPLKHKSNGDSILDSKNYTDRSAASDDGQLFGLDYHLNDQQEYEYGYFPYEALGSDVPVATLSSASGGSWGSSTKIYIRIWLDGDDKDCWNSTAGQDWCINLKFTRQ